MNKTHKKSPDYNQEIQKVYLGIFVRDPDLFAKCSTIIQDEYFDDPLRPAVRFILDYANTYRALPGLQVIEAKTGVRLPGFEGEFDQHKEWFCTDFEEFCRYRAMENAVLDGVEMLREGRGDEVSQRMRDALTIRLTSDLGLDYFDDPEARLRRLMENSATISTGWKLVDDKLFGGFVRGGLNIFLGNSGTGKSLVLQNLALNWAKMGYHGVYFSLELAADRTALKLDAMLTDRGTRDILQSISDSAFTVKVRGKKYGQLHIKKYPGDGTTCNHFRAYLKEYEIINGRKPDFLLIDYLDLMHPNDRRIDVSNLFIKDKFVSEEIRSLMHETDTFGATASQLTRGSIEAQGEYDQSHTAGGISKINTSDNAIALYAPATHKERGEFDFLFLKTRESTGVGLRVKLAYNATSMRITDPTLTAKDVDQPSSYANLREEVAKPNKPEPAAASDPMERLSKLMKQTTRINR